jgi:hypothetical protein
LTPVGFTCLLISSYYWSWWLICWNFGKMDQLKQREWIIPLQNHISSYIQWQWQNLAGSVLNIVICVHRWEVPETFNRSMS